MQYNMVHISFINMTGFKENLVLLTIY